MQPENGKPDRPQMKIIQAHLSTPYSRFAQLHYADLKKVQEHFVKHQPRPSTYTAFLHPPKKQTNLSYLKVIWQIKRMLLRKKPIR